MPDDYPLTLLCHPATPAPLVRALEARASWLADGSLALAYRLSGDIARLRIAADAPARQADLLWEHTCFEAFVATAGAKAYREFNFSPSGQWASYAFSDYRQRLGELPPAGDDCAAPRIVTRRYAGRVEVEATIAACWLPANADELQLGMCAVIEAADVVHGSHSYWALHHPAARPDFHHRDSCTARLLRVPLAR